MYRQAFLRTHSKPPEIVKPSHMIRMRMGQQHRIKMPKPSPQTLKPKIGACIHNPLSLRRRDENRRPAATVPGVAAYMLNQVRIRPRVIPV